MPRFDDPNVWIAFGLGMLGSLAIEAAYAPKAHYRNSKELPGRYANRPIFFATVRAFIAFVGGVVAAISYNPNYPGLFFLLTKAPE